jgi:CRP/FNR family cyclic AMP-dependent transcriptional regulator
MLETAEHAHPSAELSLAGVRLLKALSTEELRALEERCSFRRYGAGDVVLAGHRADIGIFFMVAGAARVVHNIADSQEITIAAVVAGDTIGEVSAIDSLGRAATIVAEENCLIAELPKEEFLALIARRGDVALELLRRWARVIRALDEKVSYLSTGSPDQRVYGQLIRLARRDNAEDGRWLIRELPSHQDLAEWAQTSREVVASAIGELVRRGVAERRTKTLHINDYQALKDLVGRIGQPEQMAPRISSA